MRLLLACWAVAVTALVLVLLALVGAPVFGVALAVVLGLASIGVIAGVPLSMVGVMFILGFSFTASWDQFEVAGIGVRNVLLVLGLIVLGLVVAGARHLPRLPWWIHCFALTALAVTLLQALLPVSPAYMSTRYLTSAAGAALGNRPEVLTSLAYTLINLYAVPFGVVLAVTAVPRALRWIICAFVGGVAISSLAAYLGFIGYPWLSDLVGSPVPPGLRALGYTSHPLHLATSGVMGLGLAVWTALQNRSSLKWFGRAATLTILLGLYASGSRGGAAAGTVLLAGCVLLLPTIRRRGHVVAAAAVTAMGLIALFVPALGTAILRTTRVIGDEASEMSDLGRAELLEQSLTDFAHSPIFGIGTRFMAEAHVLYAGVLASGGLLLFVAYVLFNVGSFRAAFQAVGVDRLLGGALLATLLASLAYWSVGDEFTVATVQIVYGILVAVLIQRIPGADDSPAGPAGPAGAAALSSTSPAAVGEACEPTPARKPRSGGSSPVRLP